jgi:hypothetical protein
MIGMGPAGAPLLITPRSVLRHIGRTLLLTLESLLRLNMALLTGEIHHGIAMAI